MLGFLRSLGPKNVNLLRGNGKRRVLVLLLELSFELESWKQIRDLYSAVQVSCRPRPQTPHGQT
jgi:hypothetical protein